MPSFAYLFERFPSFVQTFVYREALEMDRQGMEPWLVSIRRPEDSGGLANELNVPVFYLPAENELRKQVDAERAARRLPWRVHKAIPRHRTESDAQRMFEAIWLAPHLRERGLRHVHAHFGGVAARTAWWLQKLYGITYSFTGHANDIFCETEFSISNSDLVHGARFIVTETDYALRWLQQKYPLARARTHRVFNGIEIDDFEPRLPATHPPLILSVGRCVEKKGFADLIEACRLLDDRGVIFRCEIVGGGPLQAALQTRIDRAELGHLVTMPGPCSQREVRARLASAAVFTLPCVLETSGGSDNLPTVIMEAMAVGVPVVSTRVAGIPEMILDGEDGLLVPPRDPAALAAAIERLLREPATAERFAAKARAAAAEKFAIEKCARALKHLLVEHAGVIAPQAARTLDPGLHVAGNFGNVTRAVREFFR